MERVTITKDDIKQALTALGIRPGDRIMVHSSLKALGRIEGGAQEMIAALQETVTEQGIVAMPAFSDCTDGGTRPPFHRENTSVEDWIGIIPETFRKTAGVHRSDHPTHSVSAWGADAEAFLSQTDPLDCFADDGPWGKLAQNGKIVFIGPTTISNTFLHACEKWFAEYLDEVMAVIETDGGAKQVRVTSYPGGCRGGWYPLGKTAPYYQKLVENGVYIEKTVGESSITVCDAAKLKEAMRKILADDKHILLHKCGCKECARLRAK